MKEKGEKENHKKMKCTLYTDNTPQESVNANCSFMVRPELSAAIKYLPDFAE